MAGKVSGRQARDARASGLGAAHLLMRQAVICFRAFPPVRPKGAGTDLMETNMAGRIAITCRAITRRISCSVAIFDFRGWLMNPRVGLRGLGLVVALLAAVLLGTPAGAQTKVALV